MENNVLSLKRRKCWLWFPIRFTKYEVMEKNGDYELVITTGLLAKHINRIKLYRINDITYDRTIGNFFCGVAIQVAQFLKLDMLEISCKSLRI